MFFFLVRSKTFVSSVDSETIFVISAINSLIFEKPFFLVINFYYLLTMFSFDKKVTYIHNNNLDRIEEKEKREKYLL